MNKIGTVFQTIAIL